MHNNSVLYLTQGSGNSLKPVLVMAQLGLSCELRYLDVLAGATRQSGFLKINPSGVVPYMTLIDGNGIGESNAIAWYLAEGSQLIPDSALTRAQAIQWMNFEQTSLEPNISPARFFTHVVPEMQESQAAMLPVWTSRGSQALAILDAHLSSRDFVTDYGYSVADIAVFGYTHLAKDGGFDLDEFKQVTAWIDRVQNQPGFKSIDELLTGNDHCIAA